MKNRIIFFTLLLFLAVQYACGPVRKVVPLKKGEKEVSLSLGGPLIGFGGSTIPLPLSSLDYAQGLNDTYTLSGSLHTTALAFGTVQLEGGLLRNLWLSENKKTGISAAPSFYFMIDVWEWHPKFYPWLDLNFYTHYGKRDNLIYLSYSSMFELSKSMAFNENVDNRYIPFLSLGHEWKLKKWNLKLEMKYINFLRSHEKLTVDYKVPGKNGAMGVYLGITRKLY
ncbi:MAG: hypothetical protein PHT69_15730 [Bacteroidales bacterium]|nr:hypothetical protein [Bacteroidales bacterium]